MIGSLDILRTEAVSMARECIKIEKKIYRRIQRKIRFWNINGHNRLVRELEVSGRSVYSNICDALDLIVNLENNHQYAIDDEDFDPDVIRTRINNRAQLYHIQFCIYEMRIALRDYVLNDRSKIATRILRCSVDNFIKLELLTRKSDQLDSQIFQLTALVQIDKEKCNEIFFFR
jgi:hypothetical protein